MLFRSVEKFNTKLARYMFLTPKIKISVYFIHVAVSCKCLPIIYVFVFVLLEILIKINSPTYWLEGKFGSSFSALPFTSEINF